MATVQSKWSKKNQPLDYREDMLKETIVTSKSHQHLGFTRDVPIKPPPVQTEKILAAIRPSAERPRVSDLAKVDYANFKRLDPFH